ncbi:MAG: hypothetical protein N2513_04445 [Deltaproteobacteria bacterium]|nr:hypothetical protein [Deltaproteobacteria bacterium]
MRLNREEETVLRYLGPRTDLFLDESKVRNYIILMTEREKKMLSKHIEEVFRGSFVRQEVPSCSCGKIFTEKDLYEAPGVYFRKVDVFGKTVTLIEPICPVCKKRVETTFTILN